MQSFQKTSINYKRGDYFMKNSIIEVQDVRINVTSINEKDYICISDIAKAKSNN